MLDDAELLPAPHLRCAAGYCGSLQESLARNAGSAASLRTDLPAGLRTTDSVTTAVRAAGMRAQRSARPSLVRASPSGTGNKQVSISHTGCGGRLTSHRTEECWL